MRNNPIFLKVSNFLRICRRQVLAIRNGAMMNFRGTATRNSSMDTVIVLSLGNLGRSAEVAKQAFLQGYRVHVFCKDYPTPEARFAHSWTKLDCRSEFDLALRVARKLNPKAILFESKNLLLPMQNFLASELGLKAVGVEAATSSNSKIRLREALDEDNVPNLPWRKAEDFEDSPIGFPLVIKPDLGTGSKGVRFIGSKQELSESDWRDEEIVNDESVGDEMILEQYVEGRQFDVEGLASNEQYFPIIVVEEFYEASPPYFPPKWFYFNPPISDKMRTNLVDTTKRALKAFGVREGAWHCEQRIDSSGTVRVLDYANRMGYNALISAASGVSFSAEYIRAMTAQDYSGMELNPVSLIQIFAFDNQTVSKMKKLVGSEPEAVQSKSFFPYEFAFHLFYGYIVVRSNDHKTLCELLAKYDLVPDEFEKFYNA